MATSCADKNCCTKSSAIEFSSTSMASPPPSSSVTVCEKGCCRNVAAEDESALEAADAAASFPMKKVNMRIDELEDMCDANACMKCIRSIEGVISVDVILQEKIIRITAKESVADEDLLDAADIMGFDAVLSLCATF